jgi:hypothetical protein
LSSNSIRKASTGEPRKRSTFINGRRTFGGSFIDPTVIEKDKALHEMSQAEFLREVTIPDKLINEYR